jgi:hypothetical protein
LPATRSSGTWYLAWQLSQTTFIAVGPFLHAPSQENPQGSG